MDLLLLWRAIDTVHRKLLNEQHRREERHARALHIGAVSRPAMTAGVDQERAELDEIEAELRIIVAARREYIATYGKPGD
jgi:hypothetical protein